LLTKIIMIMSKNIFTIYEYLEKVKSVSLCKSEVSISPFQGAFNYVALSEYPKKVKSLPFQGAYR